MTNGRYEIQELKKQLAGTTGNLCGLAKEVVELLDQGQETLDMGFESQVSSLVSSAVAWYGEGGVALPHSPKWEAGIPIYKELEAMKAELESSLKSQVIPESVIVGVEELSPTTTNPTTNPPQSGGRRRNKVSSPKSDVLKERISKLNGSELLVEVTALRGKLRDAVVSLIEVAGIKRGKITDPRVDALARNLLYYWESGSNNKRVYGRLFGEADRLAEVVKAPQSLSSIVGNAIKPAGNRLGNGLLSAISTSVSTIHSGVLHGMERAMVQSQVDGARLIDAAQQGHREAQKIHYKGTVQRAKDKRFLKLEAQYLEVKLNQELAKEAAKDMLNE